jgi:DNA invertase Pin-like site-specific DNA recombinase
MEINRRYVAYYRVSKDSHEAGNSKSKGLGLGAQRQIVEHYYLGNIVEEFTETKSAKNITERPVLQEAIRYCIENDAWLCVAKLDRLGRNTIDVLTIVKMLNRRVTFCDIPSEGEADEFMITLFAALAARERELISIRTSQALRVKIAKEGKWQGKSEKWMKFKKDMIDSGELNRRSAIAKKALAENNENTIRALQVIGTKRAENMSFGAISDLLNEKKFLSPEGKMFYPASVSRLYSTYIATKIATGPLPAGVSA